MASGARSMVLDTVPVPDDAMIGRDLQLCRDIPDRHIEVIRGKQLDWFDGVTSRDLFRRNKGLGPISCAQSSPMGESISLNELANAMHDGLFIGISRGKPV